MAQDFGWFIHTINTATGETVGNSTTNQTVNTDSTGAGTFLETGETFQVGTKTYTFIGTGMVDKVEGFYAKSNGQQFFFCYCPGTAGRSGQPEAGNQVRGIAGQGVEQVPALLSRS